MSSLISTAFSIAYDIRPFIICTKLSNCNCSRTGTCDNRAATAIGTLRETQTGAIASS